MSSVRPILMGGEWVSETQGGTVDVENPATGETIVTVAAAGPADIDGAVTAAHRALSSPEWAGLTPTQRGRLVSAIGRELLARKDEVAELESRDSGKPLRESHGQLQFAADCFEYFGGLADKVHGDVLPGGPDFLNYVSYEPIGVVGGILPWNSPLLISAWKIAPALAAGCTIVLKVARQAPLSSLLLGEIIESVGIPAGVVSIVTDAEDSAGPALVEHPLVDKVVFTGSTNVGKLISGNAGRHLKPSALELGGKSPFIVFPDAPFEKALNTALPGAFSGQGQSCVAGSRIYVHHDVYEDFAKGLVQKANALRIGDPVDPETQMGPQISAAHLARVEDFVASARDEGATLLCGGERPANLPAKLRRGHFYTPTIFARTNEEMRICRDEVFGPVTLVMEFRSEDEVVARANDSRFGLAAGVWTSDVERAHRMARRLEAGTVWINTYKKQTAFSPHGGFKWSGDGRDNGVYAIHEYLQTKSVWLDLTASS
jgi:(Z)-2-((N-methylformamido)methylene)-5-hydroxybutyrolactone dehydrogenase